MKLIQHPEAYAPDDNLLEINIGLQIVPVQIPVPMTHRKPIALVQNNICLWPVTIGLVLSCLFH
ncbi:hypothetical protein EP47_05905 [Legionella norrlandica]|uniref:Uncharacterized protein n=1 Tax=Legionella norrlandica TaxID=1498499 RepID=A0A0A2SVJ7_9GAMM|nr:hypothetical protein EP47_05905 [Legionella norrlandica]